MGFTSEFFLFIYLPMSIIVYAIANIFKSIKINNIVLIILSYLFYAWSSLDTLGLFILITILVFLSGKIIDLYKICSADKAKKKILFIFCFICVCYLIISKYSIFIIKQFGSLLDLQISFNSLVVPIGISFITFESISYIVDVYRGDATSGTFLELALFLSFFPKLISGPIVQWKDFFMQINKRSFSVNKISNGIGRICIGLAKKAIIADSFGRQIQIIENGMATVGGVDTQTLWLKAILYFFQIYYDFSGYSDIAIGLSNILGFEIKDNFNYPYTSNSITEFWRRWHISLGTWFREYVYIPLGGNRSGNVYINLFIVFLLTGIWHGSNWTFIVWGIVNGLFIVIERAIRDYSWYKKVPSLIKWCITTIILFFEWIIFASDTLIESIDYMRRLFMISSSDSINFTWRYYLTNKIFILLTIAIFGAMYGAFPYKNKVMGLFDSSVGLIVRRIGEIIILITAILFIVNSSYSPFLYFQF